MATMRSSPTTDEFRAGEVGDEADSMPLLLSARQAAKRCGRSLRTWRTWDAIGLIPKPVRIGRNTLWRAEELRAWITAGCPRRTEWEARS